MATLKWLLFIDALFAAAAILLYYSLTRSLRREVGVTKLALLMTVPAIGLFGMQKEVFYCFLFFVPLLFMRDRAALACVYVLLLPLYPELSEPYMMGSLYVINVSAWMALNTGALMALLFASGRGLRKEQSVEIAAVILFFLFIFMSARGVPLSGTFRIVVVSVLTFLPPYMVLSRCVRSRDDVVSVTIALILSALCNAVVAVFEARRHWPLFERFYLSLDMSLIGSASLQIRSGIMRAQGAIGNPATLSVLLACAIIGCFALRSRFSRFGYYLILSVLSAGMIVSQSRGGWIGAICGVIAFWLYERQTKALVGLVASGLAATITVAVLPASSFIGQMLGRSGDGAATADYRSNLLTRGLEEFSRHPLRGQSSAELEVSLNDMRQSQQIIDYVNTHLYVMLTCGLVGLVFWVIAWGTPVVRLWSLRPRYSGGQKGISLGLPLAMLVTCFFALAFTSLIDRMVPIVAMSLGLTSSMITIRRLSKTADPARPISQLGLLKRVDDRFSPRERTQEASIVRHANARRSG